MIYSGGVLVYWVIKLFGYCRDEKYAYIVVRRYSGSFCGNEIYILILKMRYAYQFCNNEICYFAWDVAEH